jgi:hypothetical protein
MFVKPEHPTFIVIRWSIFLNGDQLYIFHKLYHAGTPSSRRLKWIYRTHNLELGQESYVILKMLQAAKPEVPVFTDQTRI